MIESKVWKLVLAVLAVVIIGASGVGAQADPTVRIASRNQSITAVLLQPDGPAKGAVILFAGGNGRLDIQRDGTIRFLQQNFLVRARALFAESGYAVLLPDLAADMKLGDTGVVANYRASQNYATDVNRMQRYLRGIGMRRIVLIGTSRGTLSVANAVSRMARLREDRPNGQIYSSGYWKLGAKAAGLTIWKLAGGDARTLRLRTLLVAHDQDMCPDTNPADLDAFQTWLTSGTVPVSAIRVTGGSPPQSGPCDALAPHGFYGLDGNVVQQMADWMGQGN